MAWLYKQPQSSHWRIGERINGVQHTRTTGTADRAKAEEQLAAINALQASPKGMLDLVYEALSGKTTPNYTLKKTVEQWLGECASSTAEQTFQRYTSILGEFCKHVGATPDRPLLQDVTSENLRTWLQARRQVVTASTTNLEKNILGIFFRWSLANKMLRENPMLSIKRFKAGREETIERRALTVPELQLIYVKAPDDFWRYMIVGGFSTSLRMGDLITLCWDSVDLKKKRLHVLTRKRDKTVHLPITTDFDSILTARANGHTNLGGPLWPDHAATYEQKGAGPFSNQFYDLVLAPCGLVPVRKNHKKAKDGRSSRRTINAVSFHCLRHSCISLLKATGASQAVAKEIAGHSTDAMSDLYTHCDERELDRAIKALPSITNKQIELSL